MVHYYDEEQTSAFIPFLIPIHTKKDAFKIYSASGVFSIKKLDKGSETLINYAQPPKEGTLLDLGCGYGVVGFAIKRQHPQLDITLSDVNERALKLARKNAQHLNLKVTIKKSDLFKKLENYDCILVNPPYVAGRKLLFELIESAKEHLNNKGSLQLVARHQKGGKALEKKMEEVFGNVTTLGKSAGFRVYCSLKE